MSYILRDSDGACVESPVHVRFGLTYASYLVLPRLMLAQAPFEWQQRLVALIDEFNETFRHVERNDNYTVQVRDNRGRFVRDPLADYRHGPTLP